ncbi:hypothetical protein EGM51_04965 [Verrucomicrobia bacterium S94]|nr:hypothetical protein EGM51_04965 [Verrucomicrobia bacterium S94]
MLIFLVIPMAGSGRENSAASLRAAIEYLSATFGEEYPHGAEYLRRLEQISDETTPAFTNLQREALLNHPHVKGYDWLVEVRNQYWGSHGPINTMFQNGDVNKGDLAGIKHWHSHGGRLEVISIQDDGSVVRKAVLAEEPEGTLRDVDVHFDGKKILYSMRRNKEDDYHLYEMDLETRETRQLTFGSMISDVDPIYMPDGMIIFSSTRDPKFCQCNRHISNNLFSMEGDGANIQQISFNALADFHSSLMPDGRVLYSRWEYVDRHFGPSLGLWTTNPDGTRHALFMGNNAWSPGFIGDARVIPGTDRVVCIYGACHDLPWGALAVVDRSKGLEGPESVIHMWPESGRALISPDDESNQDMKHAWHIDKFRKLPVRYEDPYPVHHVEAGEGGGYFFLVAKALDGPLVAYKNAWKKDPVNMAIVLVDVFGNEVVVYELDEPHQSPYGPVPLAARPKPPVIPNAVDFSRDYGQLYVNDVYLGTGNEMTGLKRGEIKYLRIVEAPPRRMWTEGQIWGIDAAQVTAMNWNLTNNKKILGDVPVEEDGSAFFSIPADTFVQILALDENKQMVQAMRSGTVVRPGETQGCIGCHENRLDAPSATNPFPLAMRRPPSRLEPWLDTPSVEDAKPFNYLTDVQPVFDRHCVSCHDYGTEGGEVLNLCGDLSLPFNVSYTELMAKSGLRYEGVGEKLVNAVQDGPPGVLPAYAWGSHRSKLVRVLQEGHYDVSLSDDEMHRIISWIDVNAVYYGAYASYYNGRNPILSLKDGWNKQKKVMLGMENRKKIAEYYVKHGHLINFSRPELSPVLRKIQDETQRAEVLAVLQEASALLAEYPREDQTNSNVAQSAIDKHNDARFMSTRRAKEEAVRAILEGRKVYPFKE